MTDADACVEQFALWAYRATLNLYNEDAIGDAAVAAS